MSRRCSALFLIVCLSAVASLSYAAAPGTVQWSYFAGGEHSSPAIGPDGTIYVGSESYPDGPRAGLYAVNPDGSLKWWFDTQPPNGYQLLSSPVLARDGTIYLWSMSEDWSVPGAEPSGWGTLHAIGPDGAEKWQRRTPPTGWVIPMLALGLDDTIYGGMGRGGLYAFSPQGELKWQAPLSSAEDMVLAIAVAADGTIYGNGSDGYLYALNPDGSRKWRSAMESADALAGLAIGSEGTVYVGAYSWLYAMNPDGTLRWRLSLDGAMRSSPAIGQDGTIYVHLGSQMMESQLVAVSPEGACRWRTTLGYYQDSILQHSSPTIAADGTIYIGTIALSFHAVNSDGTPKWQIHCNDVSTAPAIGSDGTVYVNTWSGLYAIAGDAPLANSPWPAAGHDSAHTARQTRLGDINADGAIDTLDLLILANSWDLSFGQPGFDYRCDLDNDGTVGVLDLLTLAGNWDRA